MSPRIRQVISVGDRGGKVVEQDKEFLLNKSELFNLNGLLVKYIPDYPQYIVCNNGKVYSLRFQELRELAGGKDTKGYLQVCLSEIIDGTKKQSTKKVHRLVAEAFVPNPNNLPEVNHIDENKLNPAYSNLEWMTTAQNIEYSQAYKYKLTHKDGSEVIVNNINTFCREALKKPGGAGNFSKLKAGTIKTCYGYVKIERIEE